MFKATVIVRKRPKILDPQGKAVEQGAKHLGFNNVLKTRIGKYTEFFVDTNDREAADNEVRQYCEKLLVNPNIEDYKYSGPRPFSKETALVMMCDSVEAATKSLENPDSEKINSFVETIIDKQIGNNQFENCSITFKDIKMIKDVIKKKLANIYHIRVEYPEI